MTHTYERKSRISHTTLEQALTDGRQDYQQAPNSVLADAIHMETDQRAQNSALADDMTGLQSRRADLDEAMRQKLEARFGTTMAGLKVFEDEGLRDLGAYGYAKGNEIHIAAEDYNLNSQRGQQLLMHEAGHVIQQGSGLASGEGLLYDAGLEAQADAAFSAPPGFTMPSSGEGPVQGGLLNWLKKKLSRGGERQAPQPQQAPPPQPAPTVTPEGIPVGDLQGQRDYMFNATGTYRENTGDATHIPAIVAQGRTAMAPLRAGLSTLGSQHQPGQLKSREPIVGGVQVGGWHYSPETISMTNQYMTDLTGQLDSPEMQAYLGSVGNMMGGTSYDSVKQSGSVSDYSNFVMSQLPTRGFSPIGNMDNSNPDQVNRIASMNAVFGMLERVQQSKDPQTGELPETYRSFAPLMQNYEALRSGTMNRVLPHVRDEVVPKLTQQERGLARPGQPQGGTPQIPTGPLTPPQQLVQQGVPQGQIDQLQSLPKNQWRRARIDARR